MATRTLSEDDARRKPRDVDMTRVLRHQRFMALGPCAQAAYLELLACRTGRETLDAVDSILARSSMGALAMVQLTDDGLVSTEPAGWAWWVRLPWIVDGAEAIEEAELANR